MASRRQADVWLAPLPARRLVRERDDRPVDLAASLARRQDGTVARWQLLAAGLSSKQIQRLVAAGHLRVVSPGVYAVGQRALPPGARLWLAVLAAGPTVALSARSAAEATGAMRATRGRPITLVLPPGRHSSPPGARTRRCVVPTVERTVARGLPVLRPERAILDAAVLDGAKEAERLWRAFRDVGALDHDAVQALLERHFGEPGTPIVRDLHDRRNAIVGAAETGLEEEVAAAALLAGFPVPERNVSRVLSSGTRVRFDLFLPDLSTAIEADGPYHDDPEVAAADARRDADAARDGIRTIRVSYRLHQRARVDLLSAARRRLSGVNADLTPHTGAE